MTPNHLAARGDHAGLWDWNLATNRVHFSPRWAAMVGVDERSIGNAPEEWLTRVHPDDAPELRRRLEEFLAAGPSEFDCPHRLRHADGTYRWMSCHGVVVRAEGGEAVRVMGCHADVTAERVSDASTGLPNRLLFMDHLARALGRARRNPAHHFAVLLIDLGRSLPHDDAASPPSADPLLTAAARRLETALRDGGGGAAICRDHMVARLRGDEFAMLLDGLADVGDARFAGDRVLEALLAPFMVDGGEVFLSSSVGVAVSATGYATPEAVVRDADTALHRARLLGGARAEAFDTATLRSAQHAVQLDTNFMGALGRGEFVLHYQPVVSLGTHRVAGFEALVRWRDPMRGIIPPSEFIPIAEKTGFIVELGRWGLREACRQVAAWRASQPAVGDVWVSVNLSSPHLRHPALIGDVTQALAEAGLPARNLVVELTESVAMQNPAAVKSLLMQLRVMGVRVALDDFGTGQSSLAYLHQFPADKLKLDRSFVCDVESRSDVRDIVGAVTGLAHQLGLEVIAEGVETDGQLNHMRSLGCEYVQGYYFSRPVGHERAAELLQSGFPARADVAPAAAPPGADVSVPAGPAMARNVRAALRTRALYVAASVVLIVSLAGWLTRDGGNPAAPVAAVPREAAVRGESASSPPTGAPAAAPAAAPTPIPAAPRTTATSGTFAIQVAHKHTLRDCRGRLNVTARGLAYVPEKAEDRAKDGFVLPFGQFTSSVSDDELTVKSSEKTYRFKVADTVGKDRARTRLAEFDKRLKAAEPGRPSK